MEDELDMLKKELGSIVEGIAEFRKALEDSYKDIQQGRDVYTVPEIISLLNKCLTDDD